MKDLWLHLGSSLNYHFIGKVLAALLTTTFLSGVIGLEREQVNRPAGIRTHLLVGVSSALTMLTSEYLLLRYGNSIAIDPTRLGAQVISGIGFLGAGTIIKEGYHVKGLTTAASLWSVACIGLAVGSGFYSGAIILTIIVFTALQFLKRVLDKHSSSKTVIVYMQNLDSALEKVKDRLEDYHLFIHYIEIIPPPKGMERAIKINLSLPPELNNLDYILSRLRQMDDVNEAFLE